jgi:hypothetical protein
VIALGDQFNLVKNLAQHIPADRSTIVILHSDQLSTVQNLVEALKATANWIWVFVIICWALAVWLVPGRRRREIRAIAIGLIVTGVLLLVIRSVAGHYIVNRVIVNDSVKPAVQQVWGIVTNGLRDAAWSTVLVGVVATIAAWLTGPGKQAASARAALAPRMRRPEVAYPVFIVLLVLLLWILPVQESRTDLILAVLAIIGFEVFRRQVARETAVTASGGSALGGMRERLSGLRGSDSASSSRTEELERLSRLHDSGALSDEEFAAAKADLLT